MPADLTDRISALNERQRRILAQRLRRHPDASAPAKQESRAILAAFVRRNPAHGAVSSSDLRAHLAQKLPRHMVPSRIEFVDTLPLTANGKIDRRRLEEMAAAPIQDAPEPPRPSGSSPKQDQLLDIWRDLLNQPQLQTSDNFFDHGGDSILAVQAMARAKKAGIDFTIAQLFRSPTVAELVTAEDTLQVPPHAGSLVSLQSKGDKKALFCIHGYTGDVFGFVELAKGFAPHRPVYGLQARGLDGDVPRQTSFEAMASSYAKEIRAVQPEGPYHLLGQSLGGWIAYAVAQELKALGAQVGSLGLLDTQATARLPYFCKLIPTAERIASRAKHHLKSINSVPKGERMRYMREKLRWLRFHLRGGRGDQELVKQFDEQSDKPANYYYFARIGDQYRPERYDGDIDLFVCLEDHKLSHTLFWHYLARGCVRAHKMPGGHHTVIDEKHAPVFAQYHDRLLDDVEAKQRGD